MQVTVVDAASVDTSTTGDSPVFWMFLAILATFVATRLITRRIRARAGSDRPGALVGDIALGGVHIHHQVFGIVLMTGTGLVLLAATPDGAALDAGAAVFGIGVGLAFDEFALWVHMRDVYWTAEGRQSVDAVFCVLLVTGMLLGGVKFVVGAVGSGSWWSSIVGLVVTAGLSVLCALKGKLITALVGMVFAPVAVVGAVRLGKPASWWARRRYDRRPGRRARAEQRFGDAYQRRWNRVRDLVGGAPST